MEWWAKFRVENGDRTQLKPKIKLERVMLLSNDQKTSLLC